MAEKRDAAAYVDDFLNGRLPINPDAISPSSAEEAIAELSEIYDFTEEDFQRELLKSKDRFEGMLGIPLTDDQLLAVSGGKSEKTELDIAIGGGVFTGAAALGISTGFAVLIAIGIK